VFVADTHRGKLKTCKVLYYHTEFIQIGLSFERNMALIDSSLEYIGGIMCCSEIYEQLYCHYEHNSVDMLKGDLVDQYASLMKYLLYVKRKLKQRKTGL
jgi:hypothetical protein